MIILILISLTPFSADRVEILKESGASIIHLIGNVVIEDSHTTITCRRARLNETDETVALFDSVLIADNNGKIHADYARYILPAREGYLRGNVVLLTGDQTVRAESLCYNGIKRHVKMFREVVLEDPENNLVACGEEGWYDLLSDIGYLLNTPTVKIAREEKDPIMITAHEFKLLAEEDLFYGYDSVVALIDSITVRCDTFRYDLRADDGDMVNPFVVEKNNELKGKRGYLRMKGKEVELFRVEEGWSRYYAEGGSKNIVEGDTITILFNDGKASKILVNGMPRGVLYMREE